MQISFAVAAKLISAFVFATRVVQFLFFLNPKFQASSHLLWLYSPVCVRPSRKPEHWFSHDAAQLLLLSLQLHKIEKRLGRVSAIKDEEKSVGSPSEDSAAEPEVPEEETLDVNLGPKSHISLLDQHSELKRKAEGEYRNDPKFSDM